MAIGGMLFDCSPGAARHSTKRLKGYYQHAARGLSGDFLVLCHLQDAFGFWADYSKLNQHCAEVLTSELALNVCRDSRMRTVFYRWLHRAEFCVLVKTEQLFIFSAKMHLLRKIFVMRLHANLKHVRRGIGLATAAARWHRHRLFERWRRATVSLPPDLLPLARTLGRRCQQSWALCRWLGRIGEAAQWRPVFDQLVLAGIPHVLQLQLAAAFKQWRRTARTLRKLGKAGRLIAAQLDTSRIADVFVWWADWVDHKVRMADVREFFDATLPAVDDRTIVQHFLVSWRHRRAKAFLKWKTAPKMYVRAMLYMSRWAVRARIAKHIQGLEQARTNISMKAFALITWRAHTAASQRADHVDSKGSNEVRERRLRNGFRSLTHCWRAIVAEHAAAHFFLLSAFDRWAAGCHHAAANNTHVALYSSLNRTWELGRCLLRWRVRVEEFPTHLDTLFKAVVGLWAVGRGFKIWARYVVDPASGASLAGHAARKRKVNELAKRRVLRVWHTEMPVLICTTADNPPSAVPPSTQFDDVGNDENAAPNVIYCEDGHIHRCDDEPDWPFSLGPPPIESATWIGAFDPLVRRAHRVVRDALRHWKQELGFKEGWLRSIITRIWMARWAAWHKAKRSRLAWEATLTETAAEACPYLFRDAFWRKWRAQGCQHRQACDVFERMGDLGDDKAKARALDELRDHSRERLRELQLAVVADVKFECTGKRHGFMRWSFHIRHLYMWDRISTARIRHVLCVWSAFARGAEARNAAEAHLTIIWAAQLRRHAVVRWQAEACRAPVTTQLRAESGALAHHLRTLTNGARRAARFRQLLQHGATAWREAVLRAALRRLAAPPLLSSMALSAAGLIGTPASSTRSLSNWSRRSTDSYRPFSPTSSTFDSPFARSASRRDVASLDAKVRSQHANQRRCFRRCCVATRSYSPRNQAGSMSRSVHSVKPRRS